MSITRWLALRTLRNPRKRNSTAAVTAARTLHPAAGDPAVATALVAALMAAKDPIVRQELVAALVNAGATAVPPLREALEDQTITGSTRQWAVRALAEMRPWTAEIGDALLIALLDADRDLASAAIGALEDDPAAAVELLHGVADAARRLDAIARLLKDGGEQARRIAIRVVAAAEIDPGPLPDDARQPLRSACRRTPEEIARLRKCVDELEVGLEDARGRLARARASIPADRGHDSPEIAEARRDGESAAADAEREVETVESALERTRQHLDAHESLLPAVAWIERQLG